MHHDVVKILNEEFLKEAASAPKLFKDLSKVEQYIAESYKTRSLIELIQNADDAGAKNFGIFLSGTSLVVGNDGRPLSGIFSVDDLADVGVDDGTHVADYGADSKFNGKIVKVKIEQK